MRSTQPKSTDDIDNTINKLVIKENKNGYYPYPEEVFEDGAVETGKDPDESDDSSNNDSTNLD